VAQSGLIDETTRLLRGLAWEGRPSSEVPSFNELFTKVHPTCSKMFVLQVKPNVNRLFCFALLSNTLWGKCISIGLG